MKRILIYLIITIVPLAAFSQDISGQWNGELKIQEGLSLRLIFHIEETDSGYSATMDSPDQNATGIPVSSVQFNSPDLTILMDRLGAKYMGKLEGEVFSGTFSQSGQSFPLQLSRKEIDKKAVIRPQEPKPPFPYVSEEVRFSGGAEGVELAGTLTLPESVGPHPAVILISGSGPQNRNEELMNHKPFLVLADYLTRNGIGVLRYDDRGYAESTGNFAEATSLDFTSDALAAVAFLRSRPEVDTAAIGLIGHSEGGLIAPIAATRSDDVAFIVLLAGPGVSGREIILQQTGAIGRVSGLTEEQVENELRLSRGVFDLLRDYQEDDSLETRLRDYLEENIPGDEVRGMSKSEFINVQVGQMTRPWFRYFLVHEPAPYLEKVRCPVLAVNGAKDLQVIPENLNEIEKALHKGGNQHVTVREFPGLNHLFQECETGSIVEYAAIEQTFSPVVLEFITDWIHRQDE